jgi:hypothetical protein
MFVSNVRDYTVARERWAAAALLRFPLGFPLPKAISGGKGSRRIGCRRSWQQGISVSPNVQMRPLRNV